MRAWLEDEGSLCSTIGRTEEVKAKPLPLAKCATFYPVSGHFLGFGSASALLPLHLSARRGHHGPSSGPGRQRSLSTPRPRARPRVLRCLCGRQALQARRRYRPSRRPCTARPRPRRGRRRPPHGLPRSRRRAQRRGSSGTSPAAARRPHLTKGEKTLFVLPFLPPVDPNERRSSAQMFFFRHLIRSLRMK